MRTFKVDLFFVVFNIKIAAPESTRVRNCLLLHEFGLINRRLWLVCKAKNINKETRLRLGKLPSGHLHCRVIHSV